MDPTQNVMTEFAFTLNGAPVRISAPPDQRVIDLLREDLGKTGTKEGCGTGECGACTILVDGEPRLSCLMLAGQLAGHAVETVESIETTATGQRLVAAFASEGAVQCGYCIPGMEMAALALLRRHPMPDRDTIRQGLSGNLCRCTGYVKIVDAVTRAAQEQS